MSDLDKELSNSNTTLNTTLSKTVVNPARRNFGKTGAGLGAAVIASVASRPALGTLACETPSSFLSANLSHHGLPIVCSGKSPNYWKTNPQSWPTTGASPVLSPGTSGSDGVWNNNGTTFHPFFDGSLFVYGSAGGPTSYSMMQVCAGQAGTDPSEIGAFIVAALLNARTGLTPVLSVADVMGIWNEWAATGAYQPSAGIQWTAPQIVTYLQSTVAA